MHSVYAVLPVYWPLPTYRFPKLHLWKESIPRLILYIYIFWIYILSLGGGGGEGEMAWQQGEENKDRREHISDRDMDT